MSRIEDVPDHFDQSLDLNLPEAIPGSTRTPSIIPSVPSQSTPFPITEHVPVRNDTTPELPPQMASLRSHTTDDVVKMMNRIPLFMTSLEDVEGEDGHNVELEAMRALQYEGTPIEIVQGFKEQGNEMARLKRWKDGQEFYTKGIAVLVQKNKGRSQLPHNLEHLPSDSEEAAVLEKERELSEACYINRALCNLELKNYRSTTLDCATVLRINPKNVKAYYRSSSALFALERLAEALDSCKMGLAIDPKNTAVRNLENKIQARQKALDAAKEKKQVDFERVQKERAMLTTTLRSRNIRTRKTSQSPDLEDAVIHLAPDPLSSTSMLHFPVLLLYPLHAQSDLIKAFSELDTIPQHLDYIFPLPWDKQQEYSKGDVEFYTETCIGGMVKMGKNVALGRILGSGGIEVVDGLVRINVLLKGRAANWIAEMKARKGK